MTARLTIVIRMMALMTIMYSDSEDTPYTEVVRNYPLVLSQPACKGNMGGPARGSIGLLLRKACKSQGLQYVSGTPFCNSDTRGHNSKSKMPNIIYDSWVVSGNQMVTKQSQYVRKIQICFKQ